MNIKLGYTVHIKGWDEMLRDEEVFLDSRGDLCKKGESCSFTRLMRRYCGSVAEVAEITADGGIFLEDIDYVFKDWMLNVKGESK